MAISPYPPVGFHFKVEFDISGIGENDFLFRDVSGPFQRVGGGDPQRKGEKTDSATNFRFEAAILIWS